MVKINLLDGIRGEVGVPNIDFEIPTITPEPVATVSRVERKRVNAVVFYAHRGRSTHGFFHGADSDGNVVIAIMLPPHEGCRRKMPEVGWLIARPLDEVEIHRIR